MGKFNYNTISMRANFGINLLFVLLALVCVLPVVITVSISLSSEQALNESGFGILPKQFTTEAYEFVFERGATFLRAYAVTAGVTAVGSFLSVLVVSFYAFALSRTDLRYNRFFTIYVLITMLFNGGLVPWYIVCSQFLHITNKYTGLFLPYLFNAWHVIIMRTFYKTTVSPELIEAAKIDGANEWQIFFRVASPLCKAGYATIALFSVLIFWNDWWLSLILMTDQKFATLQYYLYQVLTQVTVIREMSTRISGTALAEYARSLPAETVRFAICVIALGPILFVYPFFQRYFIKGMTIGALKG